MRAVSMLQHVAQRRCNAETIQPTCKTLRPPNDIPLYFQISSGSAPQVRFPALPVAKPHTVQQPVHTLASLLHRLCNVRLHEEPLLDDDR
jgi:hypothetical protein